MLVGLFFPLVILALAVLSKAVPSHANVVDTFSHDRTCFTQGLMLYKGFIYESCGLYGKSSLRKVDEKTGAVIQELKIPPQNFAEGMTIIDDIIYLLTWKERKLIIVDIKSFDIVRTVTFVSHSGEGWGLTHDSEQHLILSDGSDRITIFDLPTPSTKTLNKVKELVVYDPQSKKSISRVNELEYVDGFIYANVWYKDILLKIDAATGLVVQKVDLSTLYPKSSRIPTADCLNGIAHDAASNTLLLTGKLWPHYYRINLSNSDSATASGSL